MYDYLLQVDADPPIGTIFLSSAALVALIIIGMAVVMRVKRRLQQPDEPAAAGFTLSDLRQLYKSGQMSEEEFERAKLKVVEAAKRAAEREAARREGKTGKPGGVL